MITSSRDEHINRGVALAPEIRRHAGTNLIYPVDVKAGGTWFVVNEQGAIGVLLNGAAEKHEHLPPYAMSRGQWLLQLFSHHNPSAQLANMNLLNMEPFTLVLWQDQLLNQYQWDGVDLRHKPMNKDEAHIWSSSTLYNRQMQAEREGWFNDWLAKGPVLSVDSALAFHQKTAPANSVYGLIISRSTGLTTASITSVFVSHGGVRMSYLDVLNNRHHALQTNIPFTLNLTTIHPNHASLAPQH